MKKTAYQKELSIKNTQQRDGRFKSKKDILKIQSWLSLYSIQYPQSATATAMDGDFGPATERAVKNFQSSVGLSQTGIVTNEVFSHLCKNMQEAFETPLQSANLRERVVEAAENHLKNYPYELLINGEWNSGPWVRSYMDGKSGAPWFWCMGFVQAIIDQAASSMGKNFKTLMPLTYSCDRIGLIGQEKGLLHRNSVIKRDPDLIQPGDIFLIEKSRLDWVHTGIVISSDDTVIETIEGNTNAEGSRNGIAVMKRTRNFRKSKIDIFSIAPLV